MHLTNKDNKLIPEDLTIIIIHGNSSEQDLNLLKYDLQNPKVFTPEGYPVVSLDYETYQSKHDYNTQVESDKVEVTRFWEQCYSEGLVNSVPKAGKFKVPFQYSCTFVSGVSLCTNFERAYYINMGHLEGLPSIVSPGEYYNKNSEEMRQSQGAWLKDILSRVPENTEYTAHHATFEYIVSMVQGWDFIYKKQTRTQGGILDTIILSRLTKQKSHGLKELTLYYSGFEQPEYTYAIYMTHLKPRMISLLKDLYFFTKEDLGFETSFNMELEQRVDSCIRNIDSKKDFYYAHKNSFDKKDLNALLSWCLSKSKDLYAFGILLGMPEKKANDFKKHTKLAFKLFINKCHQYLMYACDRIYMDKNTVEEVAPYAGQDSYWGLKLFDKLQNDLVKTKCNSNYCSNLWDFYRKVEHPCIRVTAEIIFKGMKVDKQTVIYNRRKCFTLIVKLIGLVKEATKQDMERLYPLVCDPGNSWSEEDEKDDVKGYLDNISKAFKIKGIQFYKKSVIPEECTNVQSLHKLIDSLDLLKPAQQQVLVFQILGLPVVKLTDKDNASLDAFAFPRYEVLELKSMELLGYLRKLKQMSGLFYSAFLRLSNPDTGRIHPVYGQSVTSTFRFNCNSPNAQQMKNKGQGDLIDTDFNVRRQVIAPKGYIIVAIDLSQVELRAAAETAQDLKMLRAYNSERVDIHATTRDEALSHLCKDSKKETKKRVRGYAKTINFGMLFGIGAAGLRRTFRKQKVEFSEQQCQQFIDAWFNQYSGIKRYKESWASLSKKLGYSEDYFGRRMYLDRNSYQSRQDRQAYSNRVQGTCATIMKIVMSRIFWGFQGYEIEYIGPIHDELVMAVPIRHLYKLLPEMEHCFNDWKFSLPIRSSISVGRTYGDLEELPQNPDGTTNWDASEAVLEKILKIPKSFEFAKAVFDNNDSWVYGKN